MLMASLTLKFTQMSFFTFKTNPNSICIIFLKIFMNVIQKLNEL